MHKRGTWQKVIYIRGSHARFTCNKATPVPKLLILSELHNLDLKL